MSSTISSTPKSWQSRPTTHILAVLVVYVPVYAFALWTQLSDRIITLRELFLYPLILGGGTVALILIIHRYVLGEPLSTLQLKSGKWYTDILAGVLLGTLSLGIMMVQGIVQSSIIATSTEAPAEELVTLISGIADNPMLIALWLGPVVWIGVAAYEELIRVFALNHLWRVWPQQLAKWIVLIVTAVLFGLAHIYQSPLSVFFITIQGLLYGWYYLRFGRVWPLIIAHAIFDSLQVIQVVMVFRGV
jgi:membrane protease YdiL (CAAX protease family)